MIVPGQLAIDHQAICDVADVWHGGEFIGGKTRAFADLLAGDQR